MRIISTVPSQTELLFDLGLGDQVVGLTKFCIHPANHTREKERIGGTKNLNLEKILALQPDIIIANKEENTKEQITELARHTDVFLSDIQTIDDALELVGKLGHTLNCIQGADKIQSKLRSIYSVLHSEIRSKAIYLIWQDPIMAAGGDSYIHYMMEHIGLDNLLKDQLRYPEITIEKIRELSPDLLILSSEPYPFKEKHIQEYRSLLKDIPVLLLNAEIFSWYGSRLIHLEDEAMELKRSLEKLSKNN